MKLLLAGTALAATLFASAAAYAAPGDHHSGGMGRGFGGGGFSGFHERYRAPPRDAFRGGQPGFPHMARNDWQHGSWRHERHGDRFGWWFVVDDDWFLYPEPIYPYPDYVQYNALPPNAGAVWYRCDDPQGYYPYVARCYGPWQIVPATPPS